jgi:hypothetical protein
MRYIIAFLILITFVFCAPDTDKEISVNDEIKKSILECIVNNEKTTPKLRNYVKEILNNDIKEDLLLTKYRQNDADRIIIRQCRKKAYLSTIKEKKKENDNKEETKP